MPDNTPTAPAPFPLRPIILGVVSTAICLAIALFGPGLGFDGARYPFLVLASTGFVLVAFLAGAWRHTYGKFIVAGLGLCWMGDVLGPYDFALGAGMFLLAHLVFVAAFLAHGLDRQKSLKSLLLVLPSAAILFWLLPQVDPSLRTLVVAYNVVITAMVVTAGGTTRLIFAAAIAFYVSDIFVARWRFVDQDASNAFICYPLYYTACLLLAISIATVRRKSSD